MYQSNINFFGSAFTVNQATLEDEHNKLMLKLCVST